MTKCRMCEDHGWYWVPNGPDDCEKEPCDCMAGEEWLNESVGQTEILTGLRKETCNAQSND
jgi:hypothetical protein